MSKNIFFDLIKITAAAVACSLIVSCGGGGEDEVDPAENLTIDSLDLYGYSGLDLTSTGTADMPITLGIDDTITFSSDIYENGVLSYAVNGLFQISVDEYNNSSQPFISNPQQYLIDPTFPNTATLSESQIINTNEDRVISEIDAAVNNGVSAGSSSGISEALELPADFDEENITANVSAAERANIVSVLRSAGIIAVDGATVGLVSFGGSFGPANADIGVGGSIFVRADSTVQLTTNTTFSEIKAMNDQGMNPTITGTAVRTETWYELVYMPGATHYSVEYREFPPAGIGAYNRTINSNFTMTLNGFGY